MDLLAHLWRYPTVSIHGIAGAFSDPGTKTVIPAKVTAKFSIRQVPNMDPAAVNKQVEQKVPGQPRPTFPFHTRFDLCSRFDVPGNGPPSLGVCQEEESQQAEGYHGDRGQTVAGRHPARPLRGREGGCEARYHHAVTAPEESDKFTIKHQHSPDKLANTWA